jgi:hypothetical protein
MLAAWISLACFFGSWHFSLAKSAGGFRLDDPQLYHRIRIIGPDRAGVTGPQPAGAGKVATVRP